MPPLSHLQLSSPRTVTGCARSVPDIELTLEQVRLWYGFCVTGYVVMPEHVHLLISEPERATLALAVQMLKQNISRELREFTKDGRYWEQRYYDFNVWGECKRVEKLRYIHRNPVKRGLVERAEDWIWSSFRHYVSGVEGVVEIESQWTARRRELLGLSAASDSTRLTPRPVAKNATRTGHPLFQSQD